MYSFRNSILFEVIHSVNFLIDTVRNLDHDLIDFIPNFNQVELVNQSCNSIQRI